MRWQVVLLTETTLTKKNSASTIIVYVINFTLSIAREHFVMSFYILS